MTVVFTRLADIFCLCSAPSGCLVNIPSLPEEVEWPHSPNSQEAEATEAQVCHCPALLHSELQGSQETTTKRNVELSADLSFTRAPLYKVSVSVQLTRLIQLSVLHGCQASLDSDLLCHLFQHPVGLAALVLPSLDACHT